MTARTALFFFFLLASPAWATSTFPTAIKTHLGLASEPSQSCGLCHKNNQLGIGTVTTPFGTNMRMRGLKAGDEASLATALDAMAAENVDSDGDGVTDIDELKAGTNPNVVDGPTDGGMGGGTGGGAGGGSELPPIRYGCGANSVPGALGLLGLAFVFALRRRR
jgi:uncharacterized protein (TIGR03382 family)